MVNPTEHSNRTVHLKPRRARRALGAITLGALGVATLVYASGGADASDQAKAAENRLSKNELMTMGEEIYNQTCSGCHQVDGMGIAGVYPPLVAGASFSGAEFLTQPLEERGFLKNGKIQLAPIETHIEAVVHGIPNSRMFAFSGLLTDAEIAAVVTYERNAWGNDSGDVVQPAQVKAVRSGD